MKKKKFIANIIFISLLLMISGCKINIYKGIPEKSAILPSPALDITTAPSVTPTIEPSITSIPENTPDNNAYKHVTYEINASLHEDMPEYRFVAKGVIRSPEEGAIGYVMGLEVYDENNKLILSEDFSESDGDVIVGYPVYNEMMDTMGLHVTDVNFDGYKDVIILNNFAGAHGNTWYDCWLWDAETSSFVFSDSFAKICNPSLDREKQCIYSTGGSGAAFWGGRIYKFIDGEFVVTNDLYTDWNGLVETELKDGTMVKVREVQYGDDEELLEREKEYYRNSELWQLDNPRWVWIGGEIALWMN